MMIKQFTVKDTRGGVAFYICEIMPGVLRVTSGMNQPLFIKKDELIDAILKTEARLKDGLKHADNGALGVAHEVGESL